MNDVEEKICQWCKGEIQWQTKACGHGRMGICDCGISWNQGHECTCLSRKTSAFQEWLDWMYDGLGG